MEAQLGNIVNLLVREFKPLRIFLFGSRARGTNGAASDWDILVVLPSLPDQKYRLAQQAQQALVAAALFLPVDVLFVSEDEFSALAGVVSTLPYLATHEGKLLYAA